MTAKLVVSNCDNWDQSIEIVQERPTMDGVAGAQVTVVERGQSLVLPIKHDGETVVRFRLGDKGPDYGRYLGDLDAKVTLHGQPMVRGITGDEAANFIVKEAERVGSGAGN